MEYRKRRREKGLTQYTVAKELGVDYNKYIEVERGVRGLEQHYVDKFQEILRNATELRLKHAEKITKVKESIYDGSLRKQIKDYGYSHRELGEKLGLTQGAISNALTGNIGITSEDTMERIYDFVHEPFNKKITTNTTTKVREPIAVSEDNMAKIRHWFGTTDLKKEIYAYGFDINTLAQFLGISTNHTYNVLNNKKNLSPYLMVKLYDKLHNDTTHEIPQVQYTPDDEMEKVRNILLENGIKKTTFARMIGCTQEHLCNLLNGKRNPSMELRIKIEKELKKIQGVEETETQSSVVEEPVTTETPNNIEIVESTKEENTYTIEELRLILKENKVLKERLIEYKKKIELYEKILDKLV